MPGSSCKNQKRYSSRTRNSSFNWNGFLVKSNISLDSPINGSLVIFYGKDYNNSGNEKIGVYNEREKKIFEAYAP